MNTSILADTPMCREVYRAIRSRVVALAGGDNSHFDAAVKLELEWQGLAPKPINWVLCANEIEREENMRAQMEANHEEEAEMDRMSAAYERAMEDKYDFMKEN